MLVNIEEIKAEGLVLDEPVDVSLVTAALNAEGRATGFQAIVGFDFHAELHKVSGGVLLEAYFETAVNAPCKRCLADVSVPLKVEFTLNLLPRSKVKADDAGGEGEDDEKTEKAGSFPLSSANEDVFDGRTIELDPIIREQILLALPMDAVCRDDCKGLCPSCGKDLNESACACAPRPMDPRLAALKSIKIN
jgi:uncharacterized protein